MRIKTFIITLKSWPAALKPVPLRVRHFKASPYERAGGDRLIPAAEILTDKFDEATFFLNRYIAFLWQESSII